MQEKKSLLSLLVKNVNGKQDSMPPYQNTGLLNKPLPSFVLSTVLVLVTSLAFIFSLFLLYFSFPVQIIALTSCGIYFLRKKDFVGGFTLPFIVPAIFILWVLNMIINPHFSPTVPDNGGGGFGLALLGGFTILWSLSIVVSYIILLSLYYYFVVRRKGTSAVVNTSHHQARNIGLIIITDVLFILIVWAYIFL